jgi:hypothetical protein
VLQRPRGAEAVAAAVADAVDMSDALAADRARGTVAAILARPPLELTAGTGAYLAALAPQLPRMQLVIFGAGLQAETHAKCICAVRSVGAIVLVNRSPERAQALADRHGERAAQADSEAAGFVGRCRHHENGCHDFGRCTGRRAPCAGRTAGRRPTDQGHGHRAGCRDPR